MTSTLLFEAVMDGNCRAIRRLFEKKSNLDVNARNSSGKTPLHIACVYGWLDIVRFLVEEKQADANSIDTDGWTPLYQVCFDVGIFNFGESVNTTMAIAELLLANGADGHTKAPSSGITALHLACRKGIPQLIRLLLHHGAHIDATNNGGETPLFDACECVQYSSSHVEAIRVLLANTANRHIQNSTGRGPADMLRMYGLEEMIESYDKWPLTVSADDIDKTQTTNPITFTQGSTMVGLNPYLSQPQHALALKTVLLVRQLPVHEVAFEILGFLTPASVEKIFLSTM